MEEQVLVFTPFPLDSLQGNAVSAKRIARLLERAGVPARAVDAIPGSGEVRALIALHACRSAAAMEEFARNFPHCPRYLLLPGSDLFRCLPEDDPRPLPMMEAADSLVVANAGLVAEVPAALRHKVRVIPKSLAIEVPDWAPVAASHFRIIAVSHLRAQKDPFLAVSALELLPDLDDLELIHIGAQSEAGYAQRAQAYARSEPRFRWLGQLSHREAVALAAGSHLMVNTSLMEGGANSICEALHIGLPVLATRIPGNVGMLGDDHPGLFAAGDAAALAVLMRRARSDGAFLKELSAISSERAHHFTPELETRGWLELLRPA